MKVLKYISNFAGVIVFNADLLSCLKKLFIDLFCCLTKKVHCEVLVIIQVFPFACDLTC